MRFVCSFYMIPSSAIYRARFVFMFFFSLFSSASYLFRFRFCLWNRPDECFETHTILLLFARSSRTDSLAVCHHASLLLPMISSHCRAIYWDRNGPMHVYDEPDTRPLAHYSRADLHPTRAHGYFYLISEFWCWCDELIRLSNPLCRRQSMRSLCSAVQLKITLNLSWASTIRPLPLPGEQSDGTQHFHHRRSANGCRRWLSASRVFRMLIGNCFKWALAIIAADFCLFFSKTQTIHRLTSSRIHTMRGRLALFPQRSIAANSWLSTLLFFATFSSSAPPVLCIIQRIYLGKCLNYAVAALSSSGV